MKAMGGYLLRLFNMRIKRELKQREILYVLLGNLKKRGNHRHWGRQLLLSNSG
jgi:hypothetical protein